MGAKPNNQSRIEISSDQLKAELTEIKDRISAIETITSLANRAVVEAYVRSHINSDKAKALMKECEEPRTRDHLLNKFSFASRPALDYYLTPLREADLLRQHFDDNGTQTFEWSNLFRRLPKATIKEILHAAD